jgi:hypothetical protein
LTVWAAISWYSAGAVIILQGRITARQYVGRLDNHVHSIIQTLFPNNDRALQVLKLFSHGLKNMTVNLNIFPDLHNYHVFT